MSIRDELIDTLATADGQEISAMDLQTKRFMYGNQADAILSHFGVVELPEGEQDDDGQTYFDVGGIRVDHSGPHGAEVYVGKHSATVEWLRWHAAEYLAAARDAERRS